jgi:lipid-A-disaccharide synthase
VAEHVAGWPGRTVVLDPRGVPDAAFAAHKRAAFAAADVALAASGTVSLELAAAETPMVIAYDMSWLSRKVITAMLQVDTVTLVNLVADSRTIPEFIGERCKPAPIAAALNRLIDDEGARVAQLDAMALAMMRLGRGGEPPGLRAARSVLNVI